MLASLLDFAVHLDRHLLEFVQTYGEWVYGLLFAIIFAETGFVVTPFLPGDSLLFAAGTLAGAGFLANPALLFVLLAAAAFTGNLVNYGIGRAIGPRVFRSTTDGSLLGRLLNRKHLDQGHAFFERYGGKAVILSRFMPILRTLVPFVAGAATMRPSAFVLYNAVGAVAWVALCLGAGVIFGNVPVVKDHFSLVTIGIVFVSLLPMAVELWRSRRA